jgi:integrase
MVDRNPVAYVTVPSGPEPRLQRWREDEVAAVVRKCLELDTQAAQNVLVALGTGLRTEELLGLKWTDVELEARLVTVRTVAPPGGAKELRKGLKTDGASRVVSIDGITTGALRRRREHVEGLRLRRASLDEGRTDK